MTRTTAFVAHPDCARHDTGWNHPDHQGRLPALIRAVYRDMLTLHGHLLEVQGEPASERDLLLIHTAEHVARVRERVAEAARRGESLPLTGDTRVSGASWEAALAAAGCVLSGIDLVLRGEAANAFCLTRPPGRGAFPDRSGGFCVFNSVAIGAAHLRERCGVERVLIVEWSAAPGEGTAAAAAGMPGVRFLSVHEGRPLAASLPAGARAVGVPEGTGGAAFVEAFTDGLDGILQDFSPDFVLLSLGLDALAQDPLGGLSLEPSDFHALTAVLMDRAEAVCEGRLVSALEGGYDARSSGAALVQHLRGLTGLPAA